MILRVLLLQEAIFGHYPIFVVDEVAAGFGEVDARQEELTVFFILDCLGGLEIGLEFLHAFRYLLGGLLLLKWKVLVVLRSRLAEDTEK